MIRLTALDVSEWIFNYYFNICKVVEHALIMMEIVVIGSGRPPLSCYISHETPCRRFIELAAIDIRHRLRLAPVLTHSKCQVIKTLQSEFHRWL